MSTSIKEYREKFQRLRVNNPFVSVSMQILETPIYGDDDIQRMHDCYQICIVTLCEQNEALQRYITGQPIVLPAVNCPRCNADGKVIAGSACGQCLDGKVPA